MKTITVAMIGLASIVTVTAQSPKTSRDYPILPLLKPVRPPRSVTPEFQVKEVPVSLPPSTQVIEKPVTIGPTEGGLWLKDAPLNEVFQFLAGRAAMQFFHNNDLKGPQFLVTGQLLDKFEPIQQMEELGVLYGVNVHTKGSTVYALTSAQESVLPAKPVHYQLRYLRPNDIDQLKSILHPFLTPGTGVAEYEPKTNTIIIFDNERKAEQLIDLLKKLDQPKRQVAIETRIIRVKSNSRNRMGVNWQSILGDGFSIEAAANLNSLFNLPDFAQVNRTVTVNNGQNKATITGNSTYNGSNLVLSPTQMRSVVQALNEGGLAQQESSPTLVIEDNEEGIISIVDRVPIIVNTISETEVGQNISEDVRYKIDQEDSYGDPATTREIGVSVTVTPTILPDDTIRMKLRPRSAQIIEFIESRSGNLFPRVNESSVKTMARIPNGHSLFIGGFYEEVESDNSSKVPLFGDIPGANFLFKNNDKSKEHTSLVFVVTPRLYHPCNTSENDFVSQEMKEIHVLPRDHDYPDRERPGFNHKRNFKKSWYSMFRKQKPEPPSSPLVPYSPPVPAIPEATVAGNSTYPVSPYQNQTQPSVKVRPVSETRPQKEGKFLPESIPPKPIKTATMTSFATNLSDPDMRNPEGSNEPHPAVLPEDRKGIGQFIRASAENIARESAATIATLPQQESIETLLANYQDACSRTKEKNSFIDMIEVAAGARDGGELNNDQVEYIDWLSASITTQVPFQTQVCPFANQTDFRRDLYTKYPEISDVCSFLKCPVIDASSTDFLVLTSINPYSAKLAAEILGEIIFRDAKHRSLYLPDHLSRQNPRLSLRKTLRL